MSFEKWWKSKQYWAAPNFYTEDERALAYMVWNEAYSEGYENGFTDGDQDTYNPTGGL